MLPSWYMHTWAPTVISWQFPWGFHRTLRRSASMAFPCRFHGVYMGLSWNLHGIPWCLYDAFMEVYALS